MNIIMKLKKTSTLKRLESSQRGIGLVELIIAIAITGIIGAAATMALHQVLTVPTISNDQNTAINQVRNAVHWINRDVQSANPSSLNATPAPPKFLSLELQEWESGVWSTHTIDYSLEDTPGTSLKELWRDYDNGTTRNLIAQYIDLDNTSCSWDADANVLTVLITAHVGDKVQTRTFEVKPRLD